MSTQAGYNTVSPSGSDGHWRVAGSTTPQLLLSASMGRGRAAIFNHSIGSLYIRFGSNAGLASSGSAAFFDHKITSGTLYELPKPVWQGEVWGGWDTPAGAVAMVSETGDNE